MSRRRKRKLDEANPTYKDGVNIEQPYKNIYNNVSMGLNKVLATDLLQDQRLIIQSTTNAICVYVSQVVFLIPLILKQMLQSKMSFIREWQLPLVDDAGLQDFPLSDFPLGGSQVDRQPFFQDILHAATNDRHNVRKLNPAIISPLDKSHHPAINQAARAVKEQLQDSLPQAPPGFDKATTVLWHMMLARTVNYMTNLSNHFHMHHDKFLSKFLKALLLLNLPQADFEANRKTAMATAMNQVSTTHQESFFILLSVLVINMISCMFLCYYF